MTNTRKKVLFVITKSNWGGAQRYVYDMAVNLPSEQFDVVVALGGNGILAHKLRENDIRVIPLLNLERDINPFGDLSSFFDLIRIFKKERPYVVHLNSSKIGGIGALAGRIAKIPNIIFTSHGWAFNESRAFMSRSIIKLLSWITVLLSHKTIAVSESVHRDTKHWLFIKGKITTIHNGIIPIEPQSKERAIAHLCQSKNINIPLGAVVFGTIGELHKNKGYIYAIQAIASIIKKDPSIFYLIIGEGEERERLEKTIAHYGIENNVHLLGFIDNASTFLSAFDIFILPSVKEGLPYVLLEAGLAKLPIIASQIGGIPEIITDEKTGILTKPRDTLALTEAIERFIVSPSLQETYGSMLHQKILREFSLKESVHKTSTLY